MAVEREGFRLTDFTLDHVPGDGEQHGDVDVLNLVFISEGPSQILPLTRSISNRWVAKDEAAILLSEVENLIVVLQGKELDDVANVILSQKELLQQVSIRDQGGRELPKKFEMEDLSLYAETGRWFLSWQTEAVEVSPSPVPAQPDEGSKVDHEKQDLLDVAEASFTHLAQPDFENHPGLDEEAFHLTGITVVYTPEDDSNSSIVEVTKIVLLTGDHIWGLKLIASSTNRWVVKGDMPIAIGKDAESLTVSLQDEALEDVALAFISLSEQDFGDKTQTSKLEGGSLDRKSEVEMASMSGPRGSWSIVWEIELVDASRRRDDDLVSRWMQLEALFPWEATAESPELYQSDGAMLAFLDKDANGYGSDILRQQTHAVVLKGEGMCTDNIPTIEKAIKIQSLLVVDPRVEENRQMYAIAVSHLGAMHHERFNKTMIPEHLDQAISLLQAAIEHSSPQTNIHAECLRRLAQGYHTRYQSTSSLADSVNAITALSEACNITRHNPHILKSNLTTLLPWLYEYVERYDNTPVPIQALACLRQVTQSFSGDSTHLLFYNMTALALLITVLLKARCNETHALEELNDAISHYRVILSLLRHLPVGPHYTEVLGEFTTLLHIRESRKG